MAITEFNNVPNEELIESGIVKLVDVVFFKRTLKYIVEAMDDATSKLKFMTKRAGLNFEQELY